MGGTEFLTGDALTVKHWSALLMKEAQNNSYFHKFVGKEKTNVIQVDTDLIKDVGDAITFGLKMKLVGSGRTGDEKLEGFEEALVFYDFKTTLYLRANSVVSAGKMSLRRPAIKIKKEGKDSLGMWLAEKLDSDTTKVLSGLAIADVSKAAVAPSTNRTFYGGQTIAGVVSSVANDAAVTSTTNHLFGTAVIELLKRKAQLATPKLMPIIPKSGKYKGKKMYVAMIHPLQTKSLRLDTRWIASQQQANVRGEENPIFSGAEGIWDNVIIHEVEGIEYRASGGAFEAADVCGADEARGLFCGAQAAVHAYGQYAAWYEKMFEYGRVPGMATDLIIGVDKTRYNSEDFGVIIFDNAVIPD